MKYYILIKPVCSEEETGNNCRLNNSILYLIVLEDAMSPFVCIV